MADENLSFKININADTKQLKALNTEMRQLERGVNVLNGALKNGEGNLNNYKSKANLLQRELDTLRKKQEKCASVISNYSQKMEENRKKYEELSKSSGDHSKELIKLDNEFYRMQSAVSSAKTELATLDVQLQNTSRQLSECQRVIKYFGLQELSQRLREAGDNITHIGETFQNAGSTIESVGTGITNTFLPIASAGLLASKAALDYESSWTSVLKTVNGSTTEIENLRTGLVKLSEEIPVSINNLNELASIGGQLGIDVGNLEKFTKVIADLGVTTNISAEEGAVSLAQFMNIVQMNKEDVDRLGSAIVDLGNNFATNEATILTFAQRVAGVGASIGMSEQDLLGFSTAMASVGINAEAGKVICQVA